MKRICPTIQELLAFDAVARHESLTQAANELCISVSGVSKQIAGLEAFVGKLLLKKKRTRGAIDHGGPGLLEKNIEKSPYDRDRNN